MGKVENEIVAFDLEHGYDRKRGSYVDPDLEQVPSTSPQSRTSSPVLY